MGKQKKLILTSYGLTSSLGRQLIGEELAKDKDLNKKKIFIFHEPYYSIERMLIGACISLGFEEKNIIISGRQKSDRDILNMDYILVGEGNTFEILSLLRERGFDKLITEAFKSGCTYIGASAGAIISGVDVKEALVMDRNFVRMSDFQGLGLFNGIIMPHYTEKELEEYIMDKPDLKKRYVTILSVANDQILVLEE